MMIVARSDVLTPPTGDLKSVDMTPTPILPRIIDAVFRTPQLFRSSKDLMTANERSEAVWVSHRDP